MNPPVKCFERRTGGNVVTRNRKETVEWLELLKVAFSGQPIAAPPVCRCFHERPLEKRHKLDALPRLCRPQDMRIRLSN